LVDLELKNIITLIIGDECVGSGVLFKKGEEIGDTLAGGY